MAVLQNFETIKALSHNGVDYVSLRVTSPTDLGEVFFFKDCAGRNTDALKQADKLVKAHSGEISICVHYDLTNPTIDNKLFHPDAYIVYFGTEQELSTKAFHMLTQQLQDWCENCSVVQGKLEKGNVFDNDVM